MDLKVSSYLVTIKMRKQALIRVFILYKHRESNSEQFQEYKKNISNSYSQEI